MFPNFFLPYNFLAQGYTQPLIFHQPILNATYQAIPTAFFAINPESQNNMIAENNEPISFQNNDHQRSNNSVEIKNYRKNQEKKRKCQVQDQFTSKFQNSQRNMLSNLLHHLIGFMTKSPQFKQIMEKIIANNHLNITPSEVVQFVSKVKLRSYIKVSTIQELWTRNNPHKELSKALRIFSFYFLKQKSYLFICDSKRIKSGTKMQHLDKIRSLIQILSQS